jgi:hypothetical protein
VGRHQRLTRFPCNPWFDENVNLISKHLMLEKSKMKGTHQHAKSYKKETKIILNATKEKSKHVQISI